MKRAIGIGCAVLAMALWVPSAYAGAARPQNRNEALVLRAFSALFVDRDASVVDRLWAKDYIQHSPSVPNGRDRLKGLIARLPPNFKYEPTFVTSNGNIVMLRGRYTGFGTRPHIVVDIVRVEKGRLAEHWDVAQEEAPVSESVNGNPMFSPDEGR